MFIERIKASNFKNFKELDVKFSSLNLLVGANASGKSNFVQLLSFLSDLANLGVNNAVALQGDFDFLRNINSEKKSTEITYILKSLSHSSEYIEICYTIKFNLGSEISLDSEKVKLISNSNVFELTNSNKKLKYKSQHIDDNFPKELIQKKLNNGSCLAQILNDVFDIKAFNSKVFSFDIPKAKLPSSTNELVDLQENGSNLASCIRHIFKNNISKNMFINLSQQALPFVKDLNIENYYNKNLVLNLQEVYYKDTFLPSSILSDGTIVVFCLVVALFFDDCKLKVFEEPERALHPYLISRMVSLFYDSSRTNQIFLTTHNTEMLKCVKIEDIYLISRNEFGNSTINNIKDVENAKLFLENELGIDQLISSSILG